MSLTFLGSHAAVGESASPAAWPSSSDVASPLPRDALRTAFEKSSRSQTEAKRVRSQSLTFREELLAAKLDPQRCAFTSVEHGELSLRNLHSRNGKYLHFYPSLP